MTLKKLIHDQLLRECYAKRRTKVLLFLAMNTGRKRVMNGDPAHYQRIAVMRKNKCNRKRQPRREAGRKRRRRQLKRSFKRAGRRKYRHERAETEKMYQSAAESIVKRTFDKLLHSKQTLSILMAVTGVLFANRLSIATIGRAMARFFGGSQKHGIKQVDRLLSNEKLMLPTLFEGYVSLMIGTRRRALVTFDWTDFDKDDHTTLVVSLIADETKRAIPLIWRTVYKSMLKGNQRRHERELLATLRRLVPKKVHLIVLSDRGFGDVALYRHMRKLDMDFITRFRPTIGVEYMDYIMNAGKLVPCNGRIRLIKQTRLTRDRKGTYNVILVKKAGMKDPWCLTTSLDLPKEDIVALYGCRFQCEEAFRDAKDSRYGMGLSQTRISQPERRDRMFMLFCLAYLVHTAAGATSEDTKVDKTIRANTETKRRTHSLFRQGMELLGHASKEIYKTIKVGFKARIRDLLRKGADVAFATG